jgi:hypothetical protein
MEAQAELDRAADREFWRGLLLAGGFTAIPRWSHDPATGTAEHEAKMPDDLIATLRQLATELEITASSVLLDAHAKLLAALSGEREVATGYVLPQGGSPSLCRLTTEPDSGRTLLLATYRAESELLAHSDFPVDDLRRELASPRSRLRPCSIRPVLIATGSIRTATSVRDPKAPRCGWAPRRTTAGSR